MSCFFGNAETDGNVTGRKALGTGAHLKNDEKGLADAKLDLVKKRICGSRFLVRADIAST